MTKRDNIADDIAAVCLRQMDEYNAQLNDVIMGQVIALIVSLEAVKLSDRKLINRLVQDEIKKRVPWYG